MAPSKTREFGLIAAWLVLIALFVSGALFVKAQPPTKSDTGRYQIVDSQVKSATFLLDTTSGRIWVLNRYEDLILEPAIWEPMTRLDTNQEIQEFLKVHPSKKSLQ